MPTIKPQWEENEEFARMVRELVQEHPRKYRHIDPDEIICYLCTNKSRPKGSTKLYDMSGATEPQSFTNSKAYFVNMSQEDWDGLSEMQRRETVAEILVRIDADTPGKVKSMTN